MNWNPCSRALEVSGPAETQLTPSSGSSSTSRVDVHCAFGMDDMPDDDGMLLTNGAEGVLRHSVSLRDASVMQPTLVANADSQLMSGRLPRHQSRPRGSPA
jgi:hypothetical protein